MVRSAVRRTLGLVIAVVIIVLAAIAVDRFAASLKREPGTDDASIDADVVHVAPSVGGYIVAVPIIDNQLVKKGDLLFQIDPQPYQYRVDLAAAQLAESEALLDTKKRSVATQVTSASVAASQIDQAKDSLRLASNTLSRLQPLLPNGYVSRQQVDDAFTAKRKATVSLSQAEDQAQASKEAIDTIDAATASVAANRSSLALAQRDLRMTTIKAPHTGRVTGLSIRSGEYATPSQALFTLIVTEEWFANGNFRETDLATIHVGTCATVWSMIDRTRAIAGHVDGIGFGVTDSDKVDLPRSVPYVDKEVNWVRVQQRFPVRVKLDAPPAELMRLGASAYVRMRPGDKC